jgi:hypothetical protein
MIEQGFHCIKYKSIHPDFIIDKSLTESDMSNGLRVGEADLQDM